MVLIYSRYKKKAKVLLAGKRNDYNIMITARSSSSSSDKQQPTHWKLNLDCRHSPILKEDQVHKVRSQFNAATGEEDNFVVCPLCAKGAPGSCDRTAIHKVVNWTPMYARHVKDSSSSEFMSASSKKEGVEGIAEKKENVINVAVSNWWAQYNNVPFELRPKFRETMKLAREKPDVFVKLFASDDVVNRTTESQNILQVMKERLASLENNK